MKGDLTDWPFRQEAPRWRCLLAWLPGLNPPQRGMEAWQQKRPAAPLRTQQPTTSAVSTFGEAAQQASAPRNWQDFFKIYNVFGRTSPGQYWLFVFVTLFIVVPLLSTLPFILPRALDQVVAVIWLVLGPAIVIALLTITIRRYHDTGRRAWALPFMFTNPITILLVVSRLFGRSETGPNRFGPQP